MNLRQEKELVKRAQKDPEVFAELYDEYYSQIFGYVLKRVGNLVIAQDITSETFFRALKKLWQFRWRNISFSAWLYRIANNETANYFRKNKHYSISLDRLAEIGTFEPIALHNPEEELLAAQEELKKHEDFLRIQEKISELPLRYQEVIALRFFQSKKIQEIAEILGRREGTVKSLLHRGLQRLRELIG